jgi:hypothetical protein
MWQCKKRSPLALEVGKIFSIFSFLVLVLTFTLTLPSPANADDFSPPVFHYWHMWTDASGVSHLTKLQP